MPLLGDMQEALYYPLTWLALVLPVAWAWGVIAVLKLLTAGIGAYAFSRVLRVRPAGSIAAGVIYMLSAPLIVTVQYPHGSVYSLLPWLLLTTDRLYRRPTLGRRAGLGLVVGLALLAGHPESALLGSLASLTYLVALAVADRWGHLRERLPWRAAAGWLSAHLLGMGLGAAALVPFLQAYSVSLSGGVHALTRTNLPLSGWLLWVMPNIFGNAKPNVFAPDLTFSYFSTVCYFGVVSLLLAGVAVIRHLRKPTMIALLAVAGASLLTAFRLPPVSWILDAMPIVSSANTGRVGAEIALVGAVCAGLGVQELLRRPVALGRLAIAAGAAVALVLVFYAVLAAQHGVLPAPRSVKEAAVWRLVLMLGLGAGCAFALGHLRATLSVPLVVGVIVIDLLYLQTYNVILPPEEAHPPAPPSMTWLARQPGPFWTSVLRPGEVFPTTLLPNSAARFGIESTEGYDFPPPRRWADFSWFVLGQRGARERTVSPPGPSRANLIGQRMVNTRYYVAAPNVRKPFAAFRTVYRGRDATVFEDLDALPRAYVVGGVRPLDYAAALATLQAGAVDPRRAAVVPPHTPAIHGGGRYRAARTRELGPGHLQVSVPPGAAGWLVVGDSYSPLWTASVDGHERRLYPTNVASLGLPLDTGAHTVELRITATHAIVGLVVSLLFAVTLAGLALWGRFGRGGRQRRS
jgi:hypothetical protein